MKMVTLEFAVLIVLATTRIITGQDPCLNYTVIDDPRRSTWYEPENYEPKICDLNFGNGTWYRFTAHTGGKMPEQCVEMNRCGTERPIYLADPHPTASNPGPLSRRVCGNTGNVCCAWSSHISVKRCVESGTVEYFVYQLVPVTSCNSGYCVGNLIGCAQGTKWNAALRRCEFVTCSPSAPACVRGLCKSNGFDEWCDCFSGFAGPTCSSIDQCEHIEPCGEGDCIPNIDGSYRCLCSPGYSGPNCRSIVNSCYSSPCQNDGVCFANSNSGGSSGYTCSCQTGTYGNNCQHGGENEDNDGRDTALIVVGSLFAGLVLVGIVGFVLYKYSKSSRPKISNTNRLPQDAHVHQQHPPQPPSSMYPGLYAMAPPAYIMDDKVPAYHYNAGAESMTPVYNNNMGPGGVTSQKY